MRTIISMLAGFTLLATSCTTTVTTGSDSGSTSTGKGSSQVSIQEKGLKISNAVLMKEDGTPLPANNSVGIGEKISCRLTVDGYQVEDGKVLIGASEKVSTTSGDVVLDEPDLFATAGPLDAGDAKYVTIKAVITSLEKSIHDFKVDFRVWDKRNNKEATGNFVFHLN